MEILFVGVCLFFVIWLYFHNNPLQHTRRFIWRRFVNWFPLGMSYAFLYMGRYNLNVSKNALGTLMTKEQFGIIFGVGTAVYGLSFLLNGPLVDKIGGKKGIIIATLGSSIANIMMGVLTYLILQDQLKVNLTMAFSILYAVNMFFQSYGAVSIIKVKAYWFHVRERGVFGAIFGTLISFGVYFAFDWGQAIVDAAQVHPTKTLNTFQQFIQTVFAINTGTTDAIWLVFFIPAFILIFWALVDTVLLKDTPEEANFDPFDPHDASSDDGMDREYTMGELLRKIFTSRILLTIALIEFTSGVIRNGIMQWYFIFAKEIPQKGVEYLHTNWGFILCVMGIIGGFSAGFISDKLFHSRRGPPAAIFNFMMLILTVIMSLVIFTSPVGVGSAAVLISLAVIGVHSMMSGTAAADFGGRKATATASGIVDGFVYLGSGVQSISLGYLTTKSWQYWPLFLIPFTMMGLIFSVMMWKALPSATRKYLKMVEKVDLVFGREGEIVISEVTQISVETDTK